MEELLKELKEKIEYLESRRIAADKANSFSDGFDEGFEYGLNYVVEKIEKIIKEDE